MQNRRHGEVRRYGFYRCTSCNKTWESAFTFCDRATKQPRYKQDCKDCNVSVFAFRTEPIICSMCGQQPCVCTEEDRAARHNDPNKPHRSDLCQRCRAGKPCQRA